jgi:hypothetical protein
LPPFSKPVSQHNLSGNSSFGVYKANTLHSLEKKLQFEVFMQRLRAAKDKSEFDQFMDDRAQKPTHGATATDANPERSDPTGVRAILLKLF